MLPRMKKFSVVNRKSVPIQSFTLSGSKHVAVSFTFRVGWPGGEERGGINNHTVKTQERGCSTRLYWNDARANFGWGLVTPLSATQIIRHRLLPLSHSSALPLRLLSAVIAVGYSRRLTSSTIGHYSLRLNNTQYIMKIDFTRYSHCSMFIFLCYDQNNA